ncbi:1-phosphofructokinase [Nocardia vinacea]|uniref:1-phosphofructokinase n=1 Tax=Nocardia vinacea TaxID=96468 RepID=UPI0003162E5F|nr:1-phosphofructokinase [Nocardia vinacea]
MIVTVTPNPSVDRTVFLDTLVIGSVNRSRRSWSEPSGKGVNVALALHAHGEAVRAIVTVGGSVGAQLQQMLATVELDTVAVPIAGEIRSNISLTRADGTVTKVNEMGPVISSDEVADLLAAVATNVADASWLVCGGSLPSGAPEDLYARLAQLGRERAVPVVVDSSGQSLAASLPGHPDLIKPNIHELAELVERPLHTLGEIVDAAEDVRARGAGAVLASLGADGAVLVDKEGALHGEAPVEKVVSTVGAGDAMLAGFLAGSRSRRHAMTTALTWGAAAVQHEGTLFSPQPPTTGCTLHDRIDRRRRLRDDEPAPTAAAVGPEVRADA